MSRLMGEVYTWTGDPVRGDLPRAPHRPPAQGHTPYFLRFPPGAAARCPPYPLGRLRFGAVERRALEWWWWGGTSGAAAAGVLRGSPPELPGIPLPRTHGLIAHTQAHPRARARTHTHSLSLTRTPPQPLHEQEEALTLALVNETLFFEAAFVDLTASSAPHAPLLDDAVSAWATGKLIATCVALTYTLHPTPQTPNGWKRTLR